MDTKWKNYRYSGWLKAAAVVLCLAGLFTVAYGCLKAPYFVEVMESKDYQDSRISARPLEELYQDVYRAAFDYQSTEKIKAGEGLYKERLMGETNMFSDERRQKIGEVTEQYDEWIENARSTENGAEVSRLQQELDARMAQINAGYDESVGDVKNRLIEERLQEYAVLLKKLERTEGLYYSVFFSDGRLQSNLQGLASGEPAYRKLPVYYRISSDETVGTNDLASYSLTPDGSVVYVGMSQERFDSERKAYEANREKGRIGIYQVIVGKLLFLTGMVYLIYAAGRRPESEGVHLIWADRIYLDVELALVVPAIALQVVGVYALWENLYPHNPELFYVLASMLIILAALMGIAAGTSAVKRLKRREFLRHTLVGSLFLWAFGHPKKLVDTLRQELKKGPLALRTALLFALYGGGVVVSVVVTAILGSNAGFLGVLMGGGIFLSVNLVALVFTLKKVAVIKEITAGTERIRSGELAYRIAGTGEPETDALIDSINQMAQGLKASVENEVKAERLKAELVTNVSHDLKTPLTSIINYVDLLKTEGICSENAPRYLEVLDQKSQRLKALTEDLFEAAKASSGNMTFALEKLDITDLIAQGLGELSDKIQESGLDFKVTAPEEKVYALGDGKLLWRVMENLLSNVFKYAQPGSRVYIDTSCQNGQVLVTLKNVSAFELNIHADELMERFKRGDESRSSEGSGLGLSIARSLTELQGGSFTLAIDGDLFKVTVIMPAYLK